MAQIYEYRLGTKVVAVIDIIFAVLGDIVVGLTFAAAIYFSTIDDNVKVDFLHYQAEYIFREYRIWLPVRTVRIVLWILTVVLGLVVLLSTIAAFKLLKATQLGAHPGEASSQAKFWRVVIAVFLCLSAICWCASLGLIGLIIEGLIPLFVLLIFRGSCLYVVSKYIIELERAKATMENGVQCLIPNQGNHLVPTSAFGYKV